MTDNELIRLKLLTESVDSRIALLAKVVIELLERTQDANSIADDCSIDDERGASRRGDRGGEGVLFQ